jgi:lipid II:glycine glycyltransferase (peptidoglycan interpeptide bridge formation enzyme)
MIKITTHHLIYSSLEVWYSDSISDINGYSHVNFRRVKSKKDILGFNRREEVTSVIDLTQELDVIWKNMKKSCRNSISRAERNNVKIEMNQNFDEFYNIYKQHLRRKRYCMHVDDLPFLKNIGILFTAEYKGEVLGGHIYIKDQEHILFSRGATKILHDDKSKRTLIGNASHLINWEAMKYAKANGIREFDMGGLYTDSINAFKESFGGSRVSYYSYEKFYSECYRMIRLGIRPLFMKTPTLISPILWIEFHG